ncbi:hypothetical protein D046_5761A, partial [Vibrio parahaemolyticus V-223/04]
MEFRVERF